MQSSESIAQKSQLVMARLQLEELPEPQLEPGYTLRHYIPGDESAWNRLVSESFGASSDFESSIMKDPFFQPERVLLVEYEGKMVATACAWRYPKWGKHTGLIHMVAASAEHRGHQLGYHVSLAALHQFLKEGVHHAVLHTDDSRLAAIVTYLKLGFFPYLSEPDHAERWQKIYQILQ